jgi:TRAP-type C4-dicarboxylate transport system, periplasmic component
MSKLSGGLLSSSGLRVLGVFYFGTRQLTCDRPIRRPEDLAGVKIRAIPYPVYETIVEGLGATAVPMEWSATPTALAAKVVSGQENPVNTILNSRLYESQSYIMLTGHQISLGIFVANEQTFQRLSREQREIVQRTALEVCDKASKATMAQEADDLSALLAKGIKLIGPDQGLDLAAFRNRATKLAWERFGAGWREFYELTDRTK